MTELEELYRRHAADVHRFVLYLSGNAGDADDITSETFFRALRQRHVIQVSTAKAYLFTIARNLWRRRRRNDGRHTPLPEALPDVNPGLEQWADGRQSLAAVLRALHELDEDDRAAILMRVDGVPYEDIAASLQISVAAAKVRVYRARVRLSRSRRPQ